MNWKTITFAGLLLGAPHMAAADDKPSAVQKLIQDAIPEEIKSIAKDASEIAGLVSGAGQVIDVAESIAKLVGLTSEGPSVQDLFNQLDANLEMTKQELLDKLENSNRGRRYGVLKGSVDSLMSAMLYNQDAEYYLTMADANTLIAMGEVESQLSSPSSSAATVPDKDGHQVYDWRISVPELMQDIALRMVVIKARDANWMTQQKYYNELSKYRGWLQDHLQAMKSGRRYDSQTTICDANLPSECLMTIIWESCQDSASGISNIVYPTSDENQGISPFPDCDGDVDQRMGIPDLSAMIDQLTQDLAMYEQNAGTQSAQP